MREGDPWTDEELGVAVGAYLFLLRLQKSGFPSAEVDLQALLRGALPRRNEASIRYRMRNISSVVAQRKLPTLKAFSPAPKMGGRVKARIENLLTSARALDAAAMVSPTGISPLNSPSATLAEAAKALRKALAVFETTMPTGSPGLGHNKPPEAIDNEVLTANDLREAIILVERARGEISSAELTAESAKRDAHYLAAFGVRASVWLGQRLTKAADIALGTAARVSVLAVAASLPPLANAIEALIKALS